jgi:hypothetical protein
MLSGLLKGAAAQKLIAAARKPENQAKAKRMIADARAKRGRKA